VKAEMVGRVLAIDRIGDHGITDRLYIVVDKTIIDMLVGVDFGRIVVAGSARIVCGACVYVPEVLGHLGVSDVAWNHIEIAYDKGLVLGNFFAVIVYQFGTVRLSLVTEAEMSVHNGKAFSAFLVL
jgi:hypothetical protein